MTYYNFNTRFSTVSLIKNKNKLFLLVFEFQILMKFRKNTKLSELFYD